MWVFEKIERNLTRLRRIVSPLENEGSWAQIPPFVYLSQVYPILEKHLPMIKGEIYLYSGLVRKGFTVHDVDLIIVADMAKEDVIKALHLLNEDLVKNLGVHLHATVDARGEEFDFIRGYIIPIEKGTVERLLRTKPRVQIPQEEYDGR